MGKQVLVLGATGHIGAHICRALLAAGHRVRAAYRREAYLNALDGLPVERARVDLDTLDGLAAAVSDCEWVFHAAGYYPAAENREAAMGRAAEAARRVFEALRRTSAQRILFTSSSSTLKRVQDRPAREEDAEAWPPPEGRAVYACAKIAMEREALHAARGGLPVVILNPSICIGEYDWRLFSGRFLLLYAAGRIPFSIDMGASVVYTGDVGAGHVLAAERGRIGERYLLSAESMSLDAWIDLVGRARGRPIRRVKVPYAAARFAVGCADALNRMRGRMGAPLSQALKQGRMNPGLDAGKARRELSWAPMPMEEAVARTLRWYREAGMLK